MSEFFANLSFSFSVTGPIFVVLALGVVLARIGMISDAFIDVASRLVFNVTLPSLLFISISKTDFEHTVNLALIGYGLVGTLAVYLLLELAAARWVRPPQDRGVVVQGGFRSNMGIIGLAYCVNAYGEAGLAAASLYLGLVTILFNILSVITLNRSLDSRRGFRGFVRSLVRNPLIIGIVLALPVAWLRLPIPEFALGAGHYFAQMTLPLALLCTGGSLNFRVLRFESKNAVLASVAKLVLVPVLLTAGGAWLGFRDISLGVLFLMTSAPTAAASYVMVRAMGGNAALAANIIVITTTGSLLVTSLGITLLRWGGLI